MYSDTRERSMKPSRPGLNNEGMRAFGMNFCGLSNHSRRHFLLMRSPKPFSKGPGGGKSIRPVQVTKNGPSGIRGCRFISPKLKDALEAICRTGGTAGFFFKLRYSASNPGLNSLPFDDSAR